MPSAVATDSVGLAAGFMSFAHIDGGMLVQCSQRRVVAASRPLVTRSLLMSRQVIADMALETAQFVRAHIARSSFDQRMVNVWLTARVRPGRSSIILTPNGTPAVLRSYGVG
jgi:hypothetical protein